MVFFFCLFVYRRDTKAGEEEGQSREEAALPLTPQTQELSPVKDHRYRGEEGEEQKEQEQEEEKEGKKESRGESRVTVAETVWTQRGKPLKGQH